jgi:hypothetical protein
LRSLTPLLLLLVLWLSRLPALEALPLHNDEGLHLTRAVEVWNLHPFWEIRDGKIINHWAIALFYPQTAPVFAGRIATVFISMIGLAAGYALVRRRFGVLAATLACALWIASPYLFFFERLAFSDAEAGALVVLAFWASTRLAAYGTLRLAVFTGFAFGLAALFKFTAAPFALGVAVIVLLGARYPLHRRLLLLMVAGVTVTLMFAPPIGYLLLRGDELFSIALGWIGSGSGAQMGVAANLQMLAAQLTDYGVPLWSGGMLLGIVVLVVLRPRTGGVLLLAVGLPLAIIIVLGREVLPRHYVVAMPALLLLGGTGISVAIERIFRGETMRQAGLAVGLALAAVLLALGFVPLALTAYAAPERNPYPQAVWTQYFSQHSAGYGLREAVQSLPQTIQPPTAPVIASMTGDSCRRTNFYAVNGLSLTCADAPGLNALEAALAAQNVVYVLVEQFTGIADMPGEAARLGVTAEQVAQYTRPGADGQSVTLWKLERPAP